STGSVGFWPLPPRRERAWPAVRALAVGGALAVTVVYLSPIAEPLGARLFPFGPSANALERGSVENRLALDRDAFLIVRDHLPFGVGGGNYGLAALAGGYQEGWGEPAPNLALLIAAELGLPGILAAGVIVFATLRVLRDAGRPRPEQRVATAALVA